MSTLLVEDKRDDLIRRLAALIRRFPEFEDDLDETACPSGYVSCRFCDSGGYIGRPRKNTMKATPVHRSDCPFAALLKETEQWVKKQNQHGVGKTHTSGEGDFT